MHYYMLPFPEKTKLTFLYSPLRMTQLSLDSLVFIIKIISRTLACVTPGASQFKLLLTALPKIARMVLLDVRLMVLLPTIREQNTKGNAKDIS